MLLEKLSEGLRKKAWNVSPPVPSVSPWSKQYKTQQLDKQPPPPNQFTQSQAFTLRCWWPTHLNPSSKSLPHSSLLYSHLLLSSLICCFTHSPANPDHSALRLRSVLEGQQCLLVPWCKNKVRWNNSSTWRQKATQGLSYYGTKLFDRWTRSIHKNIQDQRCHNPNEQHVHSNLVY